MSSSTLASLDLTEANQPSVQEPGEGYFIPDGMVIAAILDSGRGD